MIAAAVLALTLQTAWMRKTQSFARAHVKPRARVRWYSRRFWFGAEMVCAPRLYPSIVGVQS